MQSIDQTSQPRIFTVSELSNLLKTDIENKYSNITLKAEISGLKILNPTGHGYFTLKDQFTLIDAVCWRGVLQNMPIKLEDGLEVICTGRITIYPSRSKYQIVVQRITLSGQGTLLKLLEERKQKLAAEGLFSSERKQLLPYLPQRIGIITSPTGAVIRDILHRIADRFPLHVVIWPTLVQGDGAAEQISKAIKGFNDLPKDHPLKPDLIIVARGGGSVEDLWCFNEEIVVRAASNSLLPLISAVGHETDVTLIDYAADRRAPTPTAAAEMAVQIKAQLVNHINDVFRQLKNRLKRLIFEYIQVVDDRISRFNYTIKIYINQKEVVVKRLKVPSPQSIIDKKFQNYQYTLKIYHNLMSQLMQNFNNRFNHLIKMLLAFSHEKILDRGFCLVQDMHNKLITSKTKVKPDEQLYIKFNDGTIMVEAK